MFRSAALTFLLAADASIPKADPTGHKDSSRALNEYIRSRCSTTTALCGSATIGKCMAPVGAIVDLEGGIYRLDAPIEVNSSLQCSGVLRIRNGTLLAGSGLASLQSQNKSFLVTVMQYWQDLGVSLEKLVFASNFTGGALRVDAAHHVHVRDSNFVNFASYAIWGSKSSRAGPRFDRAGLPLHGVHRQYGAVCRHQQQDFHSNLDRVPRQPLL